MGGIIACTLIDKGVVGSVPDYPAPSLFEIPARLGHQLESLTEDGAEGWCLFAVRDEDGGGAYEVKDAHRRDKFWHERLGGGDTN